MKSTVNCKCYYRQETYHQVQLAEIMQSMTSVEQISYPPLSLAVESTIVLTKLKFGRTLPMGGICDIHERYR